MLKPHSYRPETPTGGHRRLYLWLLIVLTILVGALGLRQWLESRRVFALQAAPASVEVRPAPDFRLTMAGGGEMKLSDLRGEVVLLNFWATWCPPCAAEMPVLESLHRDYGPEHGLVVVAVDAQESEEVVAAFGRARSVSFPLLLDYDGTVSFDLYNVRSLPTTAIVDRAGNLRDMWLGQISREAMLARLQRVW